MKFNIWKALKDSFFFYYNNIYQIFIIYLIFFIPNLLSSFLIKVNFYNIYNNYSILYYLLILFIVSLIFYTFSRIAIYIYFKNKNIKKSILESFKYYIGIIILYLSTTAIYVIFLFISAIISFLFSLIFINNFYNAFYSYLISFIILSIFFIVITNKFFLSSPIFVFKQNRVYQSLKISWENINIVESTKILIAQLLIYSSAIILIIYQQISPFPLFIKILYIFISSFLLIPIGNLFSIFIYQQYENYK